MPTPKLTIQEPYAGLPRQPVCLRLAYLVSGLPDIQFLTLLGDRTPDGYQMLTAYEYQPPHEPREVRFDFFAHVLARVKGSDALEPSTFLQLLPQNFFVWSNELAGAFSEVCRDWHGFEEAQEAGLKLIWNPALFGVEEPIDECSEFTELVQDARPSKREIGKQNTTERHAAWQARYQALKSLHPGKSDTWIAEQIARRPEGEGRSSETIRRNMKG